MKEDKIPLLEELDEKADKNLEKRMSEKGIRLSRLGTLNNKMKRIALITDFKGYLKDLDENFGEIVWGLVCLREMGSFFSKLLKRDTPFAKFDKKIFDGWLVKQKCNKNGEIDVGSIPKSSVAGKLDSFYFTTLSEFDEQDEEDMNDARACLEDFEKCLGEFKIAVINYTEAKHNKLLTRVKLRTEFLENLESVCDTGMKLSRAKIKQINVKLIASKGKTADKKGGAIKTVANKAVGFFRRFFAGKAEKEGNEQKGRIIRRKGGSLYNLYKSKPTDNERKGFILEQIDELKKELEKAESNNADVNITIDEAAIAYFKEQKFDEIKADGDVVYIYDMAIKKFLDRKIELDDLKNYLEKPETYKVDGYINGLTIDKLKVEKGGGLMCFGKEGIKLLDLLDSLHKNKFVGGFKKIKVKPSVPIYGESISYPLPSLAKKALGNITFNKSDVENLEYTITLSY